MELPRISPALRGKRVGIAGAGLAGLTAAWALQRRGAEVFVFEARSRIGGRVLTIHDLPGAAHGELGGDIIEEDDKEAITAMAGALGLTLKRVLPGGFQYYTAAPGRRGTFHPAGRMFGLLRDLLRDEIAALKRAGNMPSSAIAQSLARRSARDWAQASRRSHDAVAAVEAMRGFFAAEPAEYSLLMLVDQLSEEGDPASMKHYRISGGNSRLAAALADALEHPVQLHSRVLRIEGRHAVMESQGARTGFRFDAFVVAVPATLARQIAFEPPLPEPQWRAIAGLPYGRATKALVSFDRRFWRQRGHAFGTRLPIGAVWEAGSKGTGGTLAFLAGGEASSALAALVASGAETDWRKALSWLDIGGARILDACAMTWEADPWARGAYAHQSPAFDPRDAAHLSEPVGRVAFAGEHTSAESQGYMEGAVMSGLRAADDVELVLTDGRPTSSRPARIRRN